MGAEPFDFVFKCCVINARSICNKLDEFQFFAYSGEYDIILITETWLNSSFTNAMIGGSSYTIERKDRSSRGGGVLICIKNHISYVPVTIEDRFKSIEACAIDIFVPHKHRIVCVYRPPNSDVDYCSLLIELIRDLSNINHPFTVAGDFNAPDIIWSSLSFPNTALNEVIVHGFVETGMSQLVMSPTRGTNILDLVFTSNPIIVGNIKVLDLFYGSDHCIVDFCISCSVNSPVASTCYDFRNADFLGIEQYLTDYDWVSCFSGSQNIDEMWNKFCAVIYGLYENFVPKRKFCSGKNKRSYPEYIKRLTKNKCKAWRNRLQPGGMHQYKRLSAECSKAIRRFELVKEQRVLGSGETNKLFAYVNKKYACRGGIGTILRNGVLCTSDREKCDAFSEHFQSVFVKDNGNLPPVLNRLPPYFTLNDVMFSPILVKTYIKKLKGKFTHSPDAIPQGFLKKLGDVVCFPLCHIFQTSFQTGSVPLSWRSADIVPIYKAKDSSLPENYRPISLTSPCSKIMETIISDAMLTHLTQFQLIASEQHGFLKRKSTCTQLLECLADWSGVVDGGGAVDCVYVDFAKAFDTVCHSKLLHKLKAYGISGNLLAWHNAFLSHRSQRVKVNSSFSDEYWAFSGIPQGSVLGPLYFLIYINDIVGTIPRGVACKMFADDVKVYTALGGQTDEHYLALQTSLNEISLWADIWQLKISTLKCQCIRYGRGTCNGYYIGTQQLPCVDSIIDLGITMNTNLNFKSHCLVIAKKAYSVVNILFRCFKCTKVEFLIKAYCAYVRPILEYGSVLWSPVYVSYTDILESVQRYFTRRLFQRLLLTPRSYIDRIRYLRLDPLELRRLKTDLHMCYRIVHSEITLKFEQFFRWAPYSERTRGHPLRLLVPLARTNIAAHNFANRIVGIWNSLPEKVNNLPLVRARSLSLFSSRLNIVDLHRHLKFSRNL